MGKGLLEREKTTIKPVEWKKSKVSGCKEAEKDLLIELYFLKRKVKKQEG